MIIQSDGAVEPRITYSNGTSPLSIAAWLRRPMYAAGCTEADVEAMLYSLMPALIAVQQARGPVDEELLHALLAIAVQKFE